MKLIGKQIVVELPKEEHPKEQCRTWNDALTEVAKMNQAWEVDEDKICNIIKKNSSGHFAWRKIAQALASDPSRWMKRKE